jgi:hypothetical protein
MDRESAGLVGNARRHLSEAAAHLGYAALQLEAAQMNHPAEFPTLKHLIDALTSHKHLIGAFADVVDKVRDFDSAELAT